MSSDVATYRGDVGELLFKAANDKLKQLNVEFKDAHALTVVLLRRLSKVSVKGRQYSVLMLSLDSKATWVSHAGTTLDDDGQLISSGGRFFPSHRWQIVA